MKINLRRDKFTQSMLLVPVLMIVGAAVFAGAGLAFVGRLHNRYIHATATRQVLHTGSRITEYLAEQPTVRSPLPAQQDWQEISRLISSLHQMDGGIEYVSVTHNGMIVFQEHTVELTGNGSAPIIPDVVSTNIQIERKVLNLGETQIPVVVFRCPLEMNDGGDGFVEVAFRRARFNREERSGKGTVQSMFRLSLLTILTCFAACLGLMIWVIRRELWREQRRRQEEHLAFSGVLANGIVHDFRNPMSSLQLDLQMLRRECAKNEQLRPERLCELAARAETTVRRMDRVFQDFLFLAQPGERNPEYLDLRAALQEAVDLLRPQYDQKNVDLNMDMPDAPTGITAQPASIRRALVNVLTNAVQFSPAGSTVRVLLQRDATKAVMTIQDQGPGIPRKQHEQVFEMFVTTRPQGTGLGLFLARAAIERVGGTIHLADCATGTCVQLTFPLSGNGPEKTPNVLATTKDLENKE